jgi:hypothetical protein
VFSVQQPFESAVSQIKADFLYLEFFWRTIIDVKYIFFDMGSTLIDEKISDDCRVAKPDERIFRAALER